jgi:hypothetical protein
MAHEAAQRWIPVEEGMPKKSGRYLCRIQWHDGPDYEVCPFKNGEFWCYGNRTEEVTHWMPLPAPPIAKKRAASGAR